MTLEENIKFYNNVYNKYPEEFSRIKNEISSEISYKFIDKNLLKRAETLQPGKCVDYSKIIYNVKYPGQYLKEEINRAKYNETDNPLAFLIAGTVIQMDIDDDGRYMMLLSESETLWHNSKDYNEITHLKNTKSVQNCILVTEFFEGRNGHYSVGSIEDVIPGSRVMLTVFYLRPTSNERWLMASFTDIKYCNINLSYLLEYLDVLLDENYIMTTRNEFYSRFIELVGQSDKISDSDKKTGNNGDGGCYIATCVYGSYDCPQVWTLRRYRDYILSKSWYGYIFIHMYYAISPILVKVLGHTKWFKKIWKKRLDNLVNNLQKKGIKNTPYKDKSI